MVRDLIPLQAVHLFRGGLLRKRAAGAGSHQFLVDDFVVACASGRQPSNSVWMAARYLLPGLVAHESAMGGGVLMEVPDFGDPPTPVGSTSA